MQSNKLQGAPSGDEGNQRREEKPPAKDITVVVMGLHGMIDTALGTKFEAIHAQKLPWEVGACHGAERAFEFPNARIFKPRNVNNVRT